MKHRHGTVGEPDTHRLPLFGNELSYANILNRKILCFWILELASSFAFVFWLALITSLANKPGILNIRYFGRFGTSPCFAVGHAGGGVLNGDATDTTRVSTHISTDIWCGLSLTVAMDALAVVTTYNRGLIRRFHYAVSQRMMFLTVTASFSVDFWAKSKANSLFRHFGVSLLLGLLLYILFGIALDKMERPIHFGGPNLRWGSLKQYSREFGYADVPWWRAVALTVIVIGFGFCLTAFVTPEWSGLVPLLHILFESLCLSFTRAKRTPRYLLLSSPPFFATVCVHWGLIPVVARPHLTMRPAAFVPIVLAGRVLLDIHLRTVLNRPDLRWTRKEVLLSNGRLLSICLVMLLLENVGVKVITYIKPIMVLIFFGLGSAGFYAIAAYSLAVKM